MAVAEAKVKQWGHSLGIIISKDLVRIENINAGDIVKVEISKEKRIDGFGMFKGIPSYTKEKETHGEFW